MISSPDWVERGLVDHLLLVWVGVALAGAFLALRLVSLIRRRTGLGEGAVLVQEDADDRARAHNFWDRSNGLYGKPDLSMKEVVEGEGLRMVATELKPLQRRQRLLPSDEAQAVVYGLLHRAEYGDAAASFARVRYRDKSFDIPLTKERVSRVQRAAEAIRAIRAGQVVARRNHSSVGKCRGCSVRALCPDRLEDLSKEDR